MIAKGVTLRQALALTLSDLKAKRRSEITATEYEETIHRYLRRLGLDAALVALPAPRSADATKRSPRRLRREGSSGARTDARSQAVGGQRDLPRVPIVLEQCTQGA